jgi:hypothetical protein
MSDDQVVQADAEQDIMDGALAIVAALLLDDQAQETKGAPADVERREGTRERLILIPGAKRPCGAMGGRTARRRSAVAAARRRNND